MFDVLEFIRDAIMIVFVLSCFIILGIDVTPKRGHRISRDNKVVQRALRSTDIKWRIKMVIIISVFVLIVKYGLPYIFMFIMLVGEVLKLSGIT